MFNGGIDVTAVTAGTERLEIRYSWNGALLKWATAGAQNDRGQCAIRDSHNFAESSDRRDTCFHDAGLGYRHANCARSGRNLASSVREQQARIGASCGCGFQRNLEAQPS